MPSSRVLTFHNLKELRQLESTKPLIWVDQSLARPTRRTSYVYLTLCSTDAPQKAEMCNHKNFNGTFSCPYCEMPGRTVTASNTPEAFDGSNPFAGRTGSKMTKFPDLLHETDCRQRENRDRFRIGELVSTQKIASGLSEKAMAKMHRVGIKGIPAIHSFAEFQDVWSHTSGFLHIVCEGLAKVCKLTFVIV